MSYPKDDWWARVRGEPLRKWFPFTAVGLVLAGFAALALIGPLGLPLESEQRQLGYRGTGMADLTEAGVAEGYEAQVAAIPPEDPPYEAGADAETAGAFYENVQVLGDVSVDNFNRLMLSITNWVSPEQGCAYCHGEDGNFASDALYTKVVSRRMIQMTRAINGGWTDHVKQAGVNCYTCHRGNNVPENIWFNEKPAPEAMMIGWRNGQNRSNPQLAQTSLPADVLSRYLVDDQPIRVIAQDPRVDATGGTIKDAEASFGLMIHMSTSLGVNCAYCHNTRSMSRWEQGPPMRTTAWHGIRMAREINNEYLIPLRPAYPPNRLGPTGDAPKANCATCHQGVFKPLLGTPMIDNWPELVGPAPQQTAMAD